MSQLQLPRIHFRGDFRANVATCNNDDIAVAFPEQQFVDAAQVRIDTFGMDDATFSRWLREIAPPFGIRAGWNLYGDCYCGFVDTKVRSTHPAAAELIIDPDEDPFIGAVLELPREAVMVDLNPEGTLGTQILCDEFQFVRGAEMRIGGQPTHFYSRDVTRRNLNARGFTAFAASWYAAVTPERMSVFPGNSEVLESFRIAHEAGAGLFMAFCTYLLAPRISQQQLAQDFANGIPTQNPAIGRVIGTLGVWTSGGLQSIPVGRRLLPGAILQHDHVNFQLNPAFATIDRTRGVVTLDLMNAFLEVDDSLEKVNVGTIRLAVISSDTSGPEMHDIGDVEYGRARYETESGLLDIPYSPTLEPTIENGSLVLYQTGTNAVVLRETLRTVASDDRCLYLQEGESSQIVFRVHEQGRSPSSMVPIRLKQYNTTNRVFATVPSAPAVVDIPEDVEVPSSGELSFSVTALRAGTCIVAFLVPGEADDSLAYFSSIRVLPEDDYESVPIQDLTFQFIYEEVLRYYHLVFPAMSEEFDLSNESRVELRAQVIKDRIEKQLWDRTGYMPITRDLSDGKRRLLERWCNLVLGHSDSPDHEGK